MGGGELRKQPGLPEKGRRRNSFTGAEHHRSDHVFKGHGLDCAELEHAFTRPTTCRQAQQTQGDCVRLDRLDAGPTGENRYHRQARQRLEYAEHAAASAIVDKTQANNEPVPLADKSLDFPLALTVDVLGGCLGGLARDKKQIWAPLGRHPITDVAQARCWLRRCRAPPQPCARVRPSAPRRRDGQRRQHRCTCPAKEVRATICRG